jgi:tripartite-type tricarboxylate transporter receptor subunit TctC
MKVPEHGPVRPLAGAVLGTALTLASAACIAQALPSQVRLIVPFTAGGAADVAARPVAQGMQELLGVPVLLENRAGANTIVGAEAVARSAPDGSMLLFSTGSALAVNPAAYKKLPYDAQKDFAAVAKVVSNYHVIVARKGFAPNTIPEVVALAKSKPGAVNYGSTGIGSPTHFAGMLFETSANIQMVHVPYKGISQVVTDLLGETLDISAAGPSAVTSVVKAGKLKVLAATSPGRLPTYPDIPSMQELGYAGFTSGAWYVVVAKAGTPESTINRMNRDINTVLQRPAVKAMLEREEFFVDGNLSPAQTAKFIGDEYVKWGKIIREAKIQFD